MESSQEGRLGLNKLEYISWKGKTFSEIYNVLQKNKVTDTSITKQSIFGPLPLKHYRLTIHNSSTKKSEVKNSASIRALMETQGG